MTVAHHPASFGLTQRFPMDVAPNVFNREVVAKVAAADDDSVSRQTREAAAGLRS